MSFEGGILAHRNAHVRYGWLRPVMIETAIKVQPFLKERNIYKAYWISSGENAAHRIRCKISLT